MSDFKVLQQKAIDLPANLTQSKTSLFGTFFCSCLPLNQINTQLLRDARLIKMVAESLNFYKKEKADSDKFKSDVLVGMYIFIWGRHDTPIQWIWDKPLLDSIRSHLQVQDIHDLDNESYRRSLLALQEYYAWLMDNQYTAELNYTWHSFPLETQNIIHDLLWPDEPETEYDPEINTEYDPDVENSWSCGIFNYC
ncbi:hypothetical protein [Legionella birminghamensis]|nr:hypothetical protein [Legionella birminghamensis]STX32332.1 Uncharacterised protein [Legionella birminghamensis]